ncbi:hypothetical protein ACSYHE_03290 [Geobacillus thermodenitrificans subsp. calidus]
MSSQIQVTHFKLIFNVPVGILNRKKADTLSQKFVKKFEVRLLQEQPTGSVFILANPQNREALAVEPNRIIYQFDSEASVTVDFSKISLNLKDLFDILMLEETVQAAIHVVGTIPSAENNAMSESLKKLMPNSDLVKEHMGNLKGVGLRFLLEHHTGLWEYKIEPYIRKPSHYFLEMICNIDKPSHIMDIVDTAASAFNDFIDGKREVLNTYGIS